jgi:uncharacterized cupin superfamily protein
VVVHVRGAHVKLDPVADDEHHTGDATSAYRTLYSSADGAVEFGMWEFRGEQRTTPQDGYEEIVVVLDGAVDIECDGTTYQLSAGDVIVYDCPIGAKRIVSPEGFRAAYVVRHRSAGQSHT